MSVQERKNAHTQQYFGTPPWENRDSMEHYYIEEDYSLEQIATEVCDGNIPVDELRDHLSDHGLLDPWDDPRWLENAYCDEGHSTHFIAEEILDGAVSPETIRNRLHEFEILDEFSGYGVDAETIAAAREQFEEVPEGDESYRRFTEHGRK